MPDNPNPLPLESSDLSSTIPLSPIEERMDVETPPPVPNPEPIPSAPMMASYEAAPPQPQPQSEAVLQHHEGWLKRILDATANALGPSETMQVTRDAKTGNVTMQRVPATPSEKWHGIAAAALGGLAAGLQNAQGPGGAAKAIAAGTQYGLEMPLKRQQEAENEATAYQKQQFANAQHALLDQQITAAQFANKTQPIKWAQDQAKWELEMAQSLDSMGGEFAGNTKDAGDIADHGMANKAALEAHLGTNGDRLFPLPKSDGSIDWYRVPKDVANAKDPNPHTYHVASLDPKDPSNVIWSDIKSIAGDETYGQFIKNTKSQMAENDKVLSKAAENKKNLGETQFSGDPGVNLARASDAEKRGDKAEATRLRSLAKEQLRQKEALKSTTSIVNYGYTPPAAGTAAAGQIEATNKDGTPVWGKNFGGGDPNSAFETTARQLALGLKTENEIPARTAKGGATRQDYSTRAAQITKNMFGPDVEYNPRQIDKEYKYSSDNKVIAAFNAMDRLVGPIANPDPHNPPLLGQLEKEARRAGVWDSNAPISDVIQSVRQKYGEGEANALSTDLHDVQQNLANIMGTPGLTGGLTDQKLRFWQDGFGENMTMDALRKMSREIRTAVGSERSSAFRTNRFLRRDYGGEAITANPNLINQANAGGTQNLSQNTSQAARQPAAAPGSKGNYSIDRAMQLPDNKGKTRDQVTQDLKNWGYNPT